MSTRFRTTISITPEAHEIFKRMAEAGNMSVSRAMGEWLSDTSDAAEMIVLKMEEAKKAPLKVMRELQAVLAGMNVSVEQDIVKVQSLKKQRSASAQGGSSKTAPFPPSSNTGGKSPTRAKVKP